MTTWRFDQYVPFDREFVFGWHERPGAVHRLTPPSMGRVASEPTRGIEVGSELTLRLDLVPPPWNNWRAVHTLVNRPHRFVDRALNGPLPTWVHTHSFNESDGGTEIVDEVTVDSGPLRAPASLLTSQVESLFAYRHRQLTDELTAATRYTGGGMRVGVTGSSGLVGTALLPYLRVLGFEVVPIRRAAESGDDFIAWDPESQWVDQAGIETLDAVVHLAGEPIGQRFTQEHKDAVLTSRIGPTRMLAQAAAESERTSVFISASAIGYYGADPRARLSEESAPGGDFLAGVCVEWERATDPASSAGVRTVQVRTGIALSPRGGTLTMQLPLFRLGVGGPLSDGWLSWIALDDLIGVYVHALLDARAQGPINAVAPNPVRGDEFAQVLGAVLKRPSLIPTPAFGPKLLLGSQGAKELAFASQYVVPEALSTLDFAFRHTELRDALTHILSRHR